MPINASDHWPSLWHGIWYILGPPRGLLWIILRLFYIILPYELLIHPLIHTPDHLSLDLFTRCFIRTLRYTLGDRDMHRCRFLFFLIDRIHYHSCTLRGYDVRLVSDPFDGGEDVRGVWVGEKGTVPSLYMDRSSKDDLKDTLVVLYIHGGGFCTATALNFLSAHAHTLSVANKTFTEQGLDKKKVVYFSLEYKRAPEASIEEIVNESLRAHNWLRKKVGVTHLVLASDSAGSNVTLQMLSLLSTPERDSLKGSIWFSPFLDLSLSFPSHDIVTEYGLTFDVLTRPIVTACANHALFGHDDHPHVHDNHDLKKHPDKSPFYQCTKTLLVPPSPTLVIYSKVEMFGPVIKDWVDRIQRISGTVVEQVIEENMPHDFALIGSLAPIGDIGRTSWRTGERVASVLVKWMTDDA